VPTRDKVYINGLKENNIKILECIDDSPSWKKFWRLYKKHKALRDDYDILWVGFSGHILVPFARLISKKPVMFNALSSLSDGIIMSRRKYGFLGWRIVYCWLIDWLAFNSAHISLVDTDARKKFISHKFFIPNKKLIRLYTGVDDSIFVYNPEIKKLPEFTVLFRGALMPESGIKYMLEAAKILKYEPIKFRIMGNGYLAPLVEKMIKELNLDNIEWVKEKLPWEEMTKKMQECHLSLGQLSDHKRQELHITFKTIESMALKIPYVVTKNSYGILEFMKDEKTCIAVKPADPKDLAEKILWAKNNYTQTEKIAENAYQLFKKEFTTKKLSGELKNILSSTAN
jgi:glycosyltransferase involved in cell wall biosynthesis